MLPRPVHPRALAAPAGAAPRAAAPAAAPPRPAPPGAPASPPPSPLSGKPRLRYRGAPPPGALLAAEGVSADVAAALAPPPPGAAPPPPPPISRSDADFDAAGLAFVWGAEGLDLSELNDLFAKVGFPRRDPTRLAAALAATHATLWIRAARRSRLAREGQLLGFARATSDGALSATIWDVAVAPAWQRGGLGRALVERLTARLVAEGVPAVTLFAEPGVVGLYERLGFVKDPAGVKGLAFQPKSRAGQALRGSGAAAAARRAAAGA
jgi:GNAT superfamily N-acetyltransferase